MNTALERTNANRVTSLGITIGSVLLPPLNTLLGCAGEATMRLADVAERFPLLAKVIVIGGAALIALKVAAIGVGLRLRW